MVKFDYTQKYLSFNKTKYEQLDSKNRLQLDKISHFYKLTFQEFNKLVTIMQELSQWKETFDFETLCIESKDLYLKQIFDFYETLKTKKSYLDFKGTDDVLKAPYHLVKETNIEAKIMGRCPVASEKTLCCNLETLDAFRNCSFGCTYCSIQSYFNENEVIIDSNFKEKLDGLNLLPDQIYHFGTGQSSDSLLWGNKENHLFLLIEFAKKHPNLILEFKTKSSNVDYLLGIDIPKNVIITWSINPNTIIQNEEHRTAGLEARLSSAEKIVNKGNLVGFHFHPIIFYDEYQKDYLEVINEIKKRFKPSDCALISLGTVTFNKKTIAEIRSKKMTSKILQMPLLEVAGKYSYPDNIKEEVFSYVYNAFQAWHSQVFFYLCMEPHQIWEKVFHYRYQDNLEFEEKMKNAYMEKINQKRTNHEKDYYRTI